MKKNIFILALCSVLFTYCDDLDVIDKSAIPEEIVLGSTAGYEGLLFAAYESVNDFNYYGQQMMIGPEILADNLVLVQPTARYNDEFNNTNNSGITIWLSRYNAINETNIIIETIDNESVEGTEAEKTAIKAQAYFLRALFYHDLARAYGYEPGREVNGFNLAVPLKLNATQGLSGVVDLPRATNEEVYQQVEDDLLAAIPNLGSVATGTAEAKFASAEAARLLLARVYLYWGKNSEAATQAQAVIAGDGSDLIAPADYVDAWDDATNAFNPESLFETEILPNDWDGVDGFNNSLHSLTSNDKGGSQFIIGVSAELENLIASNPTDVRNGLFESESSGTEVEKWNGNGPEPFMENIPVLRLSEGYLIAAEALGSGAGDAIFNAYRAQRGLTGTTPATVDNVLAERRIEYMAEGHRWFDLKRLGRDIPKPVASGRGTLPYTDFRILPRLPQNDISLSSELENNPGYE
ncbi:MAG: RagB/SusD family nutrient uptake outer membrane protein [Cyclobacteriaceae bacterium]